MPQPTAAILMCPPDHYGIQYEINPWMDKRKPADHDEAMRQWRGLRRILEDAGAEISLMRPVEGLPDLVFTANAALVYRRRAVLAQFRHEQRQGEQPYAHAWLRDNGLEVELSPADVSFEGAGDALFCGDTLYAGYRIRSDAIGHQQIADSLGIRVIPMELVDEYYYHLDTCFCPLSSSAAIYYPDAFDDYGRKVLSENVEDLITVHDQEARRFACNAVVVGRTVVTNSGCPRLHEELQKRGYETRDTELGEFVKSGGSAKCLTLRLDGEDAAGWRETNESKTG